MDARVYLSRRVVEEVRACEGAEGRTHVPTVVVGTMASLRLASGPPRPVHGGHRQVVYFVMDIDASQCQGASLLPSVHLRTYVL